MTTFAVGFLNQNRLFGEILGKTSTVFVSYILTFLPVLAETLSSIDDNDYELCKILVSRLMKKIQEPNYCIIQKTEIKSSLVIRQSIGACPSYAKK